MRRVTVRLGRDDSTFTRQLARLEASLPTDEALHSQNANRLRLLKSANQD